MDANTATSPVAGETKPNRPRRRPWDAAKWFGLGLLLIGAGSGAMGMIASKADAQQVERLTDRVSANEARLARIEADAGWIKSALWALTRHAGLTVPPPPDP